MFPDSDAARRYFAAVVQNEKEQKLLRMIAADRLGRRKQSDSLVKDALEKAARDPDGDITWP